MLIVERTRHRGGITLLEVLVSCGLLVIGLTTIAALLPAASSQLAQAVTEDRAAVLLSNATAEVFNRGLVSADVLPTGTTTRTPMLVFGKVLGRLPDRPDADLPAQTQAGDYFGFTTAQKIYSDADKALPEDRRRREERNALAWETFQRRCGSDRSFVLEDVLVYDPPLYADTPVNAFSRDGTRTGPRKFRQEICWGAALRPHTAAPAPGDRATLSIVVFKREGDAVSGQMADAMPIVLTKVGSFYESDLTPTGALLRGCSWLLAIPRADTQDPPGWYKIMSSWRWNDGRKQTTRIILSNQQGFAELTGSTADNTTATVFAFEGILRVDDQVVTLN